MNIVIFLDNIYEHFHKFDNNFDIDWANNIVVFGEIISFIPLVSYVNLKYMPMLF